MYAVPKQSATAIELSIKAPPVAGAITSTIVVTKRPRPPGDLAAVAKTVRTQQESALSVTTADVDLGAVDGEPSASFTFSRPAPNGQNVSVVEVLVMHADSLYLVTAHSSVDAAADAQSALNAVISVWHWT